MDEDESAPTESQNEQVDILNLSGWQILDEHEKEHSYHFTAKLTAQASS